MVSITNAALFGGLVGGMYATFTRGNELYAEGFDLGLKLASGTAVVASQGLLGNETVMNIYNTALAQAQNNVYRALLNRMALGTAIGALVGTIGAVAVTKPSPDDSYFGRGVAFFREHKPAFLFCEVSLILILLYRGRRIF